ncbi:MAG: ABC transporter substrate-binding protein [Frankiaceae bacterium]
MARATRGIRVAVAVTAVALAAAACGGSGGGTSSAPSGTGNGTTTGGGNGQTIIWGSTDKPVSYDPAGAYDLPSWNVIYNVYQGLLRLDGATGKTVPDAAQSCDTSADFKTWTCKLKPNQKFSNGDPVTSEDVKFSYDRVLKINDPSGPSSLLAKVKTSTPDPNTVVFTLASGNSLWNYIMATAAGAIVDHKVFPADKKLADDKVIGSGPYELATYQPGSLAQFKPNTNYGGDLQRQNGSLVIKYYQDENALKLDLTQGKVDVVYPALSPTALNELKGASNVAQESGPGGAIRYLVFNTKTMPGNNDAQKLAIRRAVAYLLDRDSIANDVYQGTVAPLYSMVPQGLNGHEDVYKTEYGAGPDKAKAQSELQKAGVQTPVKVQIWWTPTHYGALSGDEYTEIKRQLEGSGLFKVDLQSTEWEQYTANCLADKCPMFQLGWFPDYPDTDNYVAQFYGSASFLNNHYSKPGIDALVKDEQGTRDAAKRTDDFKKIQEQTVADNPVLPVWQGKQIALRYGQVTGLKNTLYPDYIFRFWVLGKSS